MRRIIACFVLAFTSLHSFSQENSEPIQASDEVYDVFLVAGQSNTLNGCCKDPDIQKVDTLIVQLGRFDDDNLKLIPAREPRNC